MEEFDIEVEVVETKKEIYKIHESFMEEIEKKLTRIKKKCEKYGNEFSYEVLGFEMINIETDKSLSPNYQKYFNIKAVGTARINDWEFIATLIPFGTENVIKRYNTEVELPTRFRKSENICEHCNTARSRNELFIVRNVKTNEFIQVGRKCLQDYTNGLSAENVANFIEWKDLFRGFEDAEREEFRNGSIQRKYFDVKEIIQYAMICTDKFGYFKTESRLPTVERVRNLVWDSRKTLNDWYIDDDVEVKYDDIFNDDTDKKAQEIMQYYLSLEDKSEFIHNIQTLIKAEYCTRKEFGIISCLPNSYRKALDNEKMISDRKAEIEKVKDVEVESVYFGEIGKRYTIENMKIMYISSYETMYGVTHIYKLYDNENHIFIWKTSKSIELEDKECTVTLTIKNHSEYNGVMQTEVSRCKLV